MKIGIWSRVRRWVFPTWRRLAWWGVAAAVLAALAIITRPVWCAAVAQWSYWWDMARGNRRTELNWQSFRSNPDAMGLPGQNLLLMAGGWATPPVRARLLQLRQRYPAETWEIDYYLACWDFWNGRYAEAEKVFRQHVEDVRDSPQMRTAAGMGLAQIADRQGHPSAAAQQYLEILQHANENGVTGLLMSPAWRAVRDHLGRGISLEEYLTALRAWATHVDDPRLLKEIAFEIGKTTLLAQAAAKPEATR